MGRYCDRCCDLVTAVMMEVGNRRWTEDHSFGKFILMFLFRSICKKKEMGWACGAYGGGERCAQGFGV
jgi:hypothetical protein